MKKPLPHALPLCFGLPLLALWLSFSTPHPNSGRSTQNDTTPIATTHLDTNGKLTLELYPTLLHNHYTNINLEWQTTVNGIPGQKGVLVHRNLPASRPANIILPFRIHPRNDEILLQVTGRLAISSGNKQDTPLFTTFLPISPWKGDYSMPSAGDLSFTDSNNIFTITSAKTVAQFDKQTGWLLHYEAGGTILMGDTAGLRTDLGPADTLQPRLQLFFASTGTEIVIVKAEYTLPEIHCLLHLSYTFNAAGDMLVEQVLETDTTAPTPTAPTLSRFGMGWILPKDLDSMGWYAAHPPDKPTISLPVGLSREDSSTYARWLTLKRRDGQGLRISADSNFLRWSLHPAETGTLHPDGWTLGIYKTIYASTQRRFNYSYRVTPQASAPAQTPRSPAHSITHPQILQKKQ